ncbi:xanthine dehydrogenase family protein molybdopterin-binding subunit [Atopomonas hussainii]|uniref:xanthine dehydrogenase family protein molybdopterin-binding subunit n=1 Tax=Atopomonas hussainii TaxID=1429083 RepID=UPI0009002E1E|nr:molybdopterin cofactor-binding domain-containing protein [Atopomonas hussainii]
MSQTNQARRLFLKQLGIVGGGLIVGLPLSACANPKDASHAGNAALQPNAFIHLSPSGEVNFYLPRSEMGQGTYHGLTTLIGEELDIDPASIRVHHATADTAFNNPEYDQQITGGSTSMKGSYLPLRQAAAEARALLLLAAVQQLGVPREQLRTDNGYVLHGEQKTPYAELVAVAAELKTPKDVALKEPSEFKYIGKQRPRLDGRAKATGTAEFGLDIDFPGLQRAVLVRCPVAGGTVNSVDDSAARSMAGVTQVVTIHNGVAVVAEHYYQAKLAAAKLVIDWQLPEKLSQFSSAEGQAQFAQALDADKSHEAFKQGDGGKALSAASRVLRADYWAPYLAHATMEPMNCTVKIADGEMDVWVGSQSPGLAQGLAAFYSGISKSKIRIHSTFLGGGFGRRTASDYVGEAVAIAKASGVPVQLIWSREDDTRHDLYRPASMARFAIGLSDDGRIDTWQVRRAGPNIMAYTVDEALDAMAPGFLPNGMVNWMSKAGYGLYDGWSLDHSSVEGLYEDYDARHKAVEHVTVDPGLPCGFWRSVGHSFSGFFKESMIDEVAVATEQDPVAYRLQHLSGNPRLANTLKVAAEKAGWPNAGSGERRLGVAAHNSFASSVAQVAEVSLENGAIRVHKVVCVVDCGRVVNPDVVKAQMESGILFGLTAALHGEITLKDGVVQQSNFHDYPVLRMPQTPEIDVHIIDSNEPPTGVGEPGTPPIAAAVANALFALTGQRLRSLPLKLAS